MRRTSSWRTCRQCRRSTDPPGEHSSHFDPKNIGGVRKKTISTGSGLCWRKSSRMTQTSWLVFSKVSHLYFQKFCLFCCKFSFAGELCVQVWLLHRQPLLLRHHLPSGVSSFSKILLLFTCQQFCLTRWTRRPPWSRPPSSSPWSSITVTPTRRSTSAGMHNTSGTRNDWMLYLDTFQVLESSTGDESQPQRRHWGDQQLWHLRHPGVAVFGPNLTKSSWICSNRDWQFCEQFIAGGAKAWRWNWGCYSGLWQVGIRFTFFFLMHHTSLLFSRRFIVKKVNEIPVTFRYLYSDKIFYSISSTQAKVRQWREDSTDCFGRHTGNRSR